MLKALFYSTCIFLFAVLSTSRLYASDYFSNAFRILSEGRYFEASIEFERAIYYECDSNRIAQCKYYKSLCYKGLAKFDRALEELKKINLHTVPDTLWLLIRYEQAVCAYLNNDVNKALHEIDEIKMRSKDTLNNSDIIPLNIICLNANREWDNALTLWNNYIENLQLNDSVKNIFKKEIDILYRRENIPRFYSPGKAKNLSCFIPGSGQIYCGAVPEGLFNFLINTSLLGYTVWEFYSKYYFTGYFVGLRFFNKFYIGGINRANNLAREKNKQGTSKFNAENSSLMMRIFDAKFSGKSSH
jgi:tetratricopeptide (TPR) repeat protein